MIKIHKEKTNLRPFVDPDGSIGALYVLYPKNKEVVVVQFIKICSANTFGVDFSGNVWKVGKKDMYHRIPGHIWDKSFCKVKQG